MFIIWSGWGFLAIIVPIVTVFATTAIANATGGAGYSAVHRWPIALGLWFGAACVYALSRRFNSSARTLVDPATGQQVVLRKRHTLFWIPLQFWAAILAVVGCIYLVLPQPSGSPAMRSAALQGNAVVAHRAA